MMGFPSPAPNTGDMLLHFLWLTFPVRGSALGFRVEVAWGNPDSGPNRSRTYGLGELRCAARFAAWLNCKGCNVYVGATLKSADAPERGRVAARLATLATCLPVDIDKLFVPTADRLAALARPQLLVLTGRQPELRGQLFVRIKPTSDLATWQIVHERIVKKCGGDENALGSGRLMRLAGSVSYPSPAKILRGYGIERTSAHFVAAPEYAVTELLAGLPEPAPRRAVSARPATDASAPAGRSKPPLAAVEAALRKLPDAYAVEQRRWIKVGFALFDFDQGASGLYLWQRFSQRCPAKARETDFAKLWAGFSRPFSGHRISIGWLLRQARQPSRRN